MDEVSAISTLEADHVSEFHQWALGNLTVNTNRGLYGEWLVGKALNAISVGDARVEWNYFDLRHGNMTIEVKTSGLSQSWNSHLLSTPRFDIAPRKWIWDAMTDEWGILDPPRRPCDAYVFCLHEAVPASNENIQNPARWTFWVILTRKLNDELGSQKSVGVSTLDMLATRVDWWSIASALVVA